METQTLVAVALYVGLCASGMITDTANKQGSITYSRHDRSVYSLAGYMDDIYFVSKTRVLLVVRQRLDILEECRVWNITDTEEIVLSETVSVSEAIMSQMVTLCRRSTLKNQDKETKIIYPGTKWCGNGNDADSYDDLGRLEEEDTCCRDHDNCLPCIGAFDTRFGLTNYALWTKMHCRCDDEFYHCLKAVNSTHSAVIGSLFFNVLDIGCFAKVHPEKCVKYSADGDCIRYKTDKSQPKTWQFVDNQFDY